jgi:SPP1 family predicted phage head-tail adaptor
MATRGQKRHMVTLQNPGADVPDADGGYTQTWTALSPSPVYAEIKPATARDLERVTANAVQSTATHLVSIDYHSGVTTETRVGFGTRVLQVTSVQNPDERNIELLLVCTEVVA